MLAFKGKPKKGKGLLTITFAELCRLICGAVLAHAAHGREQRVSQFWGWLKTCGMPFAAAPQAGWSGSMQQSMLHHEPPLSCRATQASSSLLGQPPAEVMSGRAARQSPSIRRHCGCALGECRAHHAGLSTCGSSRASAAEEGRSSARMPRTATAAATACMQKAQGISPAPTGLIRFATAQRLSMTRLDLLNVRGRLA